MLLWRPIQHARQENYVAAVHYLRTAAPEVIVPALREYPVEAITSTIERIVDHVRVDGEPVTAATRTDTHVIETVRPAIDGQLSRHVLDPTRETIEDIGGDEEYPHYGWARVLVGAYSCAFCAMLASRGAVYTSKAKARDGTALGYYHTPHPDTRKGGKGAIVGGFCDCSVVQVFRDSDGNEKPWEGQKAHQALEDLWFKSVSAEGVSYGDAPNAFRRAWEKQVRAGETGLYVPESLKR